MEGLDNVIDLDRFNFTTWTSKNNLSQAVTEALVKEHFTTEEMLNMLNESHVKEIRETYKLSMAEILVLHQSLTKLKHTMKKEREDPVDVIELDSFDFKVWVSENNLTQATVDALVKEQFISEEMLKMLTKVYVEMMRKKYNLTMVESLAITTSINKLKGTDSETFIFTKWATSNGLSKEAKEALKSEDFDTFETLCMLDEPDIALIGNKFRLSLGMKKRILKGVKNLKDGGPGI